MAAPTRRPGATGKLAKAPPPAAARRLDLYHLLSAVVGAYAGLVFYSLITPGVLPHGTPPPRVDARLDLALRNVTGGRGADGLYHVRGEIQNHRLAPCRVASVTLRFLDAHNREVTRTLTTVERIPASRSLPFEARAHVPGATHFEATIDLAQF